MSTEQNRTYKHVLINILRSVDPWTSKLLRLKIPTYTQDPNLVSGDGIYKAEEWSLTRKKGAELYGTNGSQYDDDYNYLKYIFLIENMKVLSAISLSKHFDFAKYNRIFEIGCGDMSQALTIKNMFPDLQYVATDYDPYVINKCSNLPILRDIKKDVFDALNPNFDAIQDFDLFISWGVDYALEDEYLLNLLHHCKKQNIPFLICSPSVAGFTDLLSHAVRKKQTQKFRMHGWSRSIKTFRDFSHKSGMSLKIIGKHGNYYCLLFNP